MAKIKLAKSNDGIERYSFDCPGCGSKHAIPVDCTHHLAGQTVELPEI